MNFVRKLLPFTNVVANGMATVDLRNLLGNTVERMTLKLGGTFTKAQINGIRVKANGKIIFDDTGDRVDKRMAYRGIAASASYLTVDFTEIRAKTIVGQMLGALDTSFGIASLVMEIDIGAATSPTLSGFAELSPPQVGQAERGLIGKVLSFSHFFGAAGKFPMNIPYGRQGGSLIKRLHLFGTSITDVEVRKNGVTEFEGTVADLDFNIAEYGRVKQTNVAHIDFVVDGNMSNVLNAANAQTMEYYVTMAASATVIVVAEILDPLTNN